MTIASDIGPRWPTQVAIGIGLVLVAALIWFDALKLPPGPTVGVGPSAAMHLVAAFVAVLGIAHWVAAWRQRATVVASSAVQTLPHGSHAALAWVFGSLVGLIAILQFGGGFIAGSTWLFAGTARAFGERLSIRSVAIGIVLTSLVYAFFTKALSLSLPTGPIERLFFG